MIRIEDLTFGFEVGRPVLRGVTLEVGDGEILGVLGPNGCGKSTLLRLMRGAIVPDTGRVMLRGRPVHRYRPRERARQMAVVPQATAAPFPFTVWEYVCMGRFTWHRGFGGPGREDRAWAERALDLTDTRHLARRPVTRLSGGELQRVTLARALAQDAPILLLDEATSHLDIQHRLGIAELLVELHRREGRTIVHVTHDFDLAAAISDRLLLLSPRGEPLAVGPPSEVLRPEKIEEAFSVAVRVEPDPITGRPRVLPVLPVRGPAVLREVAP
ncbi:ABC transporter ATP-binding protein [Deferrisoma palaeochoriense]